MSGRAPPHPPTHTSHPTLTLPRDARRRHTRRPPRPLGRGVTSKAVVSLTCACVSCILSMRTVCNNMYGKGGLDSAETPTEPSPTTPSDPRRGRPGKAQRGPSHARRWTLIYDFRGSHAAASRVAGLSRDHYRFATLAERPDAPRCRGAVAGAPATTAVSRLQYEYGARVRARPLPAKMLDRKAPTACVH